MGIADVGLATVVASFVDDCRKDYYCESWADRRDGEAEAIVRTLPRRRLIRRSRTRWHQRKTEPRNVVDNGGRGSKVLAEAHHEGHKAGPSAGGAGTVVLSALLR